MKRLHLDEPTIKMSLEEYRDGLKIVTMFAAHYMRPLYILMSGFRKEVLEIGNDIFTTTDGKNYEYSDYSSFSQMEFLDEFYILIRRPGEKYDHIDTARAWWSRKKIKVLPV